jgi:hypothetical protein
MRAALTATLMLVAFPACGDPVYFGADAAGVGDPNPYYEDGVYSVFYLANSGRHPWRMTQTEDASRYSSPLEVLPVGEGSDPDYWTGSGSVVRAADSYHLFYTGHDPEASPKEVVMRADAPSLTGPWTKVPAATFAGAPAYDALDFRDPFVFWNAEAQAWWMLITTRHAGAAAIGLYTSHDLNTWSATSPLYVEPSPLNLEVPDLFQMGGDWFLVYSDQRDNRQVRYLTAAQSTGPYANGAFDALDGRAFYAGKTAGTEDERLLFGWVPHKQLRKDSMPFAWGGDLIVHEVTRTADGQLAVSLPAGIESQFGIERASLHDDALDVGKVSEPLLVNAQVVSTAGDRFGFTFTSTSGRVSALWLDTTVGLAQFDVGSNSAPPNVRFPVAPDGHYALDLIVDPDLGLGVLYINEFRALSFRYYGIGKTHLALFADGSFSDVVGAVLTRGADDD